MVFNHFYVLLKLYPDKPWNWEGLSYNSGVTLEIIKENPDKPWDWDELSRNLSVTWDIAYSEFQEFHNSQRIGENMKEFPCINQSPG